MILLIEDNLDDEVMALRAFRKNKIASEVVVARQARRPSTSCWAPAATS
jgi:hypothetical protein